MMGIVNPRPAIRRGHDRLIRMRLVRHAELMAGGMSSADAYVQVKQELPTVDAARRAQKK